MGSNIAPPTPEIFFIILNIVLYLYALFTIPSILGSHPQTPYPNPTTTPHTHTIPDLTPRTDPQFFFFLHFYNITWTSPYPSNLYSRPDNKGFFLRNYRQFSLKSYVVVPWVKSSKCVIYRVGCTPRGTKVHIHHFKGKSTLKTMHNVVRL